MRCPQCQHENREGAKFCEECGNRLELICPSCGTTLRLTAAFCDNCGTPLKGNATEPQSNGATKQGRTGSDSELGAPNSRPIAYTPTYLAERILAEQMAMAARGAPDGERKTITALFADIKGSTALMEELDPEEARGLVDPALKLMMSAVHRYEGYVAQSLGDGIFALFGAPIAHEDHAQRALYAALRMQEEMKQYADRLRLAGGAPLQIRVGINTGEVVVRSIRTDDLHTDYVPVGHSTNLAARMESLATPGSIVISQHTHRLVDGYFECKSLGTANVKGASEPLPIYEVLGVGPLRTRLQVAARRGLSQFVGRQHELAQVRHALDLAKEGRGQIVGVMGEPGVGKSRLCHEFKLLSRNDCLVLETFSVSHGKAYPYLPLIDLLKHYFQITPQDDERRRKEKATGRVLTLDRTLEDTLPYILFLLSSTEAASSLREMDPQIRGRRIREAVRRLLLRESLNQPLLLVFEDLHWVDSETQAFLDLMSESIATARVLLLGNYRPGYQHGWGSRTYYTRLRLDPLGEEEAEEMLATLLGNGVDLEPLKQFLLKKTDGNPLFMEEIVRALEEQGVLVCGAAGKAPFPVPLCTKPLNEIQLPPTVQGILAARIDRLGAEEKGLLQTMAVIGKEFPLGLLRKVAAQPEEELHTLLSRLQAGEFIYEQPAFPESDYTFKHALTQEVTYNSVLLEQRKILHERIAQAIEELFSGRLEDSYSELAHHYSHSGNTEKAVEYLRKAGEQAAQRSAYTDAVNYLTTAIDLLKNVPDSPARAQQELQVLVALGPALIITQGYAVPEVERIYTRARELSRQAEETTQLLPGLMGLWRFYTVRGEYQTAHELAGQITRLAQNVSDPAFLLLAHFSLGFTSFRLGEFAAAREHLEQGITLYDPQTHRPDHFDAALLGQNPGISCFAWLSWVLWHLGYPDQALARIQEACTLAHDLALPSSEAFALYFAAVVHRLRREGQAAQERAEAVLILANEQGLPGSIAAGTFLRGWALAEQGQLEEGIIQMQQGLDAWRALGIGQLGQTSMLLAQMHGKVGNAAEGLRLVHDAVPQIQKSRERWWEAELHRTEGELILQSNDPSMKPEAEKCFHKAIAIARQQGAKSVELRAATSLGRLWQQDGKKAEARQLLAEIYGWFTEGFDTGDLKDAKALLEALHSQREAPV